MQALTTLRRHRRTVAAAAIAAGALVAAGCGSVGHIDGGNATNGKKLFAASCGSCHVLADAGTTGTIGPNLDAGFFQFRREILGDTPSDEDRERAEDTIRQVVRGQIAYPTVEPSTGEPGMPKDILKGQDADDVSQYIASVAGTGETLDVESPPDGGGATDAKALFTQNCAGCHVLAAAGATGAVGPNLDRLKPPKDTVANQVVKGGGGMPAFAEILSDEQIDAVAAYVADNAG